MCSTNATVCACMGSFIRMAAREDYRYIISRREDQAGMMYLENLITLCQKHHEMAQAYRILPDELRAVLAHFLGIYMRNKWQ